MTPTPAERWAEIDDFYRELIEDHGWRQGPMREFARGLGSGRLGPMLHPGTSHETLVLSTCPPFEDGSRRPTAWIVYDSPRGRFVVRYLGPGLREARRESVEEPGSPEVLARILDWLGLAR